MKQAYDHYSSLGSSIQTRKIISGIAVTQKSNTEIFSLDLFQRHKQRRQILSAVDFFFCLCQRRSWI